MKHKKLVEAFLSWPLPDSVNCDICATIKGRPNRTGTNLLTADEADQMFESVLAVDDFKEKNKALSLALKDAISTYGPKDEIIVTGERIETWKNVLDRCGIPLAELEGRV